MLKHVPMPRLKPRQTAGLIIKLPRNKTATMQLLLYNAMNGYVYWTRGTVPIAKAQHLAHKFAERYDINATPAQRTYRKHQGRANAHLVMYPGEDGENILWWLQATPGKGSVHEQEKLMNCRLRRQRLEFTDQYLLAYRQRSRQRGGKSSWSWWLQPAYLKSWQAQMHSAIGRSGQSKRPDEIQRIIEMLSNMPLYAGIRSQIAHLFEKAKHRCEQRRLNHLLNWPEQLPWVGQRLPVWDDPPLTLDTLVRVIYRVRSGNNPS